VRSLNIYFEMMKSLYIYIYSVMKCEASSYDIDRCEAVCTGYRDLKGNEIE
jgi:hypothetical protein